MIATIKRALVPLVVLLLVAGAGILVFGGGSDDRELTAYFPSTVSLYEGSDVRVLGVPVGKVDSVVPDGTKVKVIMHYDKDVDLPANAKAVIISPAIVGDRYVQITPAYTKGATMANGATIPESRTAVPLELDQIYSNIDQLTVALGPNGANKTGALNDLLRVTAANFAGQGQNFHTAIKNFANLADTLDNNKEELFGSARKLSKFITKLAQNDKTVRNFNSSLGRVSTELAGERNTLARALKNLALGLDQVGTFVRDNRDILKKNISGLNNVAKVLVHQRKNLEEVLRVAPLALNNLQLAYNPDAGTLDTNANIGNLVNELTGNPKDFLCALVSANDTDGSACDLIQSLPLPRTAAFGEVPRSTFGQAFDPTLGGLVPPTAATRKIRTVASAPTPPSGSSGSTGQDAAGAVQPAAATGGAK